MLLPFVLSFSAIYNLISDVHAGRILMRLFMQRHGIKWQLQKMPAAPDDVNGSAPKGTIPSSE